MSVFTKAGRPGGRVGLVKVVKIVKAVKVMKVMRLKLGINSDRLIIPNSD